MSELEKEAAAILAAYAKRDALYDQLYLLECALDELEHAPASKYDETLTALLETARNLCGYAAAP
jgi:hypothetical protein